MDSTSAEAIDRIATLMNHGGVVALSGAGISTESGIPDYRGPSGAAMRRHAPMTFQAFVRDPVARRRYWARSHVGWQIIRRAEPNAGHIALAGLEDHGSLLGTITQNVDGLHQAAGSRKVIDLHGRLDRVVCLTCASFVARASVRDRLDAANTAWSASVTAVNPDGDVDLPDDALDGFTLIDCEACGGMLKPDVVYFGESVPARRVEESYELVDRARLVLVLGTSLHVFSGRRFVVHAARAGVPIVVINEGPTRADDLAVLKLEVPIGATLTALTGVLAPAA